MMDQDKYTTVEILTKAKFLTEKERENLRKLAAKITKVPDKINVPVEYMIDKQ